MSRLIDADALERDGWQMSRTVRVSKDVMVIQTRNPTDFPTIEPQRMRGKWVDCASSEHWKCSACGKRAPFFIDWENSSGWDVDYSEWLSDFCPTCGADMRGTE